MRQSVLTQLSFTEIRAPVSGRIGSIPSKAGTVVRVGDNTATERARHHQPGRSDLRRLRHPAGLPARPARAMAKGDVQGQRHHRRHRASSRARSPSSRTPSIRMTGTVTAKARIANANEGLWPGQFVKVEVVLGIEPEAHRRSGAGHPARPAGALRVRRQGRRSPSCGRSSIKRTQGGESVIGKGLEGGEQVVVDGQLRLVNGAAVDGQAAATPSARRPPAHRRAAREGRAGHAVRALHPPPGDDHPGDGVLRHRRHLRLQAASRRGRAARRLPDHPGHRAASRRQPRDDGRLGRLDPRARSSRPSPA